MVIAVGEIRRLCTKVLFMFRKRKHGNGVLEVWSDSKLPAASHELPDTDGERGSSFCNSGRNGCAAAELPAELELPPRYLPLPGYLCDSCTQVVVACSMIPICNLLIYSTQSWTTLSVGGCKEVIGWAGLLLQPNKGLG
jgi:hypothetical protein